MFQLYCGGQFENKIFTIRRNILYGDYKYKKSTGHIVLGKEHMWKYKKSSQISTFLNIMNDLNDQRMVIYKVKFVLLL